MSVQETPETIIRAAGYTRSATGWWSEPGTGRVVTLERAVEDIESGKVAATWGASFPDHGVRPLPDELLDKMVHPPPPPLPPWLDELAKLVAEKLKPIIRREIRAALRSRGRES
jgi:hypothetical protein